MDLNDLSFPVVVLCEDKTVSLPVDAEELSTCTPIGMGELTGATIIDLNGAKCVITGATKMKTKKPWWRRPLFFTVIEAELSVKHVGTVSIAELKKILVRALKRSGWAADNGSLIPRVNQAASLSDIRTIFRQRSAPSLSGMTSSRGGERPRPQGYQEPKQALKEFVVTKGGGPAFAVSVMDGTHHIGNAALLSWLNIKAVQFAATRNRIRSVSILTSLV